MWSKRADSDFFLFFENYSHLQVTTPFSFRVLVVQKAVHVWRAGGEGRQALVRIAAGALRRVAARCGVAWSGGAASEPRLGWSSIDLTRQGYSPSQRRASCGDVRTSGRTSGRSRTRARLAAARVTRRDGDVPPQAT